MKVEYNDVRGSCRVCKSNYDDMYRVIDGHVEITPAHRNLKDSNFPPEQSLTNETNLVRIVALSKDDDTRELVTTCKKAHVRETGGIKYIYVHRR